MVLLPDPLVIEAGFPELARYVVRSVGLAAVDAVGCVGTCCLSIGSDGWLGLGIHFTAIRKLPVVFSAVWFTAVGAENATEGTSLRIRAMAEPPAVLTEGEASDLLHGHNAEVVVAVHEGFLGKVLGCKSSPRIMNVEPDGASV